MSTRFLDESRLPWDREETRALHSLLVRMYPDRDAAQAAVADVGFENARIEWRAMDPTWREAMNKLHRAKLLEPLIEGALADSNVARYHDELRSLLERRPALATGHVTDPEDLEWFGMPVEAAGGLERLLRDGRSLFDAEFLELGANAMRAVARIEAQFEGSGKNSLGSGFLIAPDLVLTAYHVLFDSKADDRRCETVELRFDYTSDAEGYPRPFVRRNGIVQDIRGDRAVDWAVIRLEKPMERDRSILSIESNEGPDVGQPVFVIQYPDGRPMKVNLDLGAVVRHADEARLQYLAETDYGSSGAPVFDRRWMVVAVHQKWTEVEHDDRLEYRNQGIPIARVLEGLREQDIDFGNGERDSDGTGSSGLSPPSAPLDALAWRKRRRPDALGVPNAWDCIGREAERNRLGRAIDALREQGAGGTVLIGGPRGYGKLALLRQVVATKANDLSVLCASFELPTGEREGREELDLGEYAATTVGKAGETWLELARQAKAWLAAERDGEGDHSDAPPAADPTDPGALLRGWLRRMSASGPVLLVLDGLQAMPPALGLWWYAWLGDLAADLRHGDIRCLLVLTMEPPTVLDEGLADFLRRLGEAPLLDLALGSLVDADVQAYLEDQLDGPVRYGVGSALRELSDGVPATLEDLFEWCLRDEWVDDDGQRRPVLMRDDEQDVWHVAEAAEDFVFGGARDALRSILDRLLPPEDEEIWSRARRLVLEDPPGSLAGARQRMLEALGCAAMEGRRFTAEVLAETMGFDVEFLIDWLDDYLATAEGEGFLIEEASTPIAAPMLSLPLPLPSGPAQPERWLRHYRFRWAWMWHGCHKYLLTDRARAHRLPRCIDAIEQEYPVAYRGPVAARLLTLMGQAADLEAAIFRARGDQSTTPGGTWEARARPYRGMAMAGRFGLDIQSLLWQAQLLEERSGSRHHDAIQLTIRLALAEALLWNAVESGEGDVAAALEQAERAATLALSTGDRAGRARAQALRQSAGLAAALRSAAGPADGDKVVRERVGALMEAGMAKAAEFGALDAQALSAETREALAPKLLELLRQPSLDLESRIVAGLALGRVGDPRFEHCRGAGDPYIKPPLVDIPEGEYLIGSDEDPASPWYDPDGLPSERPAHRLTVAAFQIGRYPITNAEWACFIAAGGYENERWWETEPAKAWLRGDPAQQELNRQWYRDWWTRAQEAPDLERFLAEEAAAQRWSDFEFRNRRSLARMSAWRLERTVHEWYPDRPAHEPEDWKNARFNNPSQPVVGICWYEARAYCAWLSAQSGMAYRLPTEVQWEAAARSTDGRRYAFEGDFEPSRANTAESRLERTTPVGAYPTGSSPEGVDDLCGNVWEWTGSLWGTDPKRPTYGYEYDVNDGRENADASAECLRVVRGGSWLNPLIHARAAARVRDFPAERGTPYGFRVVCASPIS